MNPTKEMLNMLKACASTNVNEAGEAQKMIAKALEVPLKEGVLAGNNFSGIFSAEKYEPGVQIEYPLDLLEPGTEDEFIAFAVPATGAIPEKSVKGDYVAVPTYFVGAAIDTPAKYIRDSNWNVVRRMMQVMEGMFVAKMNRDAWRALISAGYSRNINVYDSAATAGLFSKRLVSLMKLSMRRNAGGNAQSVNRRVLTDLYVSPEAADDPRAWQLTEVDDVTRRLIYLTDGDEAVMEYNGVKIHTIDELGVGQEYDAYYVNTLGASFSGSKVELCVGLDQSRNNSFVMPVRQDIQIYEDLGLHRQRRVGFWGDTEIGFGVLDTRAVLLGSL